MAMWGPAQFIIRLGIYSKMQYGGSTMLRLGSSSSFTCLTDFLLARSSYAARI